MTASNSTYQGEIVPEPLLVLQAGGSWESRVVVRTSGSPPCDSMRRREKVALSAPDIVSERCDDELEMQSLILQITAFGRHIFQFIAPEDLALYPQWQAFMERRAPT